MILGIGLDLLKISRMERLLESERFRARVFTREERAVIAERGVRAAETAAGLFCAKEAYAKATGRGLPGLRLQEISVVWDPNGRPFLRSNSPDDRELSFHLSITHDGGFAAAVVVIEEVTR